MTDPREPAKNNPQQNEKKHNQVKNQGQVNIKSVHPPKPVKKTPARTARKVQVEVDHAQQKAAARKSNIITFSILTAVVLIAVAVTVFLVGILPMQRTFLTVGSEKVNTSYFLKRVVASPSKDLNTTLQLLSEELIIKQQAAANGVTPVTAQDIDTYLRNQAKGTNDTISDPDFNKWFKQQLASTGLSSSEYRDVIADEIQQQRLTDILSKDMKTTVPQVHLLATTFTTEDAATAAKAKITGSSDFATVANANGQTNGGDQGWTPIDLLPSNLQTVAAALELNVCSAPTAFVQQTGATTTGIVTSYALLMITEKADARQLTDNQITAEKNQILINWINTQEKTIKTTIHGLNSSGAGLDVATTTWLNSKVAKLVSKLPKITPTTTPATTTPASTTTTTTGVTTTPAGTTTTGIATTTGTAP
jgi:hypothetical protein